MPQVQSLPQLASLPIDEPIGLPKASPGEFASPGATVSELGRETAQLALGNQAFNEHLAEAQRYLNVKQIEINVQRMESEAHDSLSKAVTPEDAQAVHTQFTTDVNNELSKHMDDQVLARQLNLYGQQADIQMQSTVNARKATLIQHGDNAANKTFYKSSVSDAVNATMAGGDGQAELAKLDAKLQSSVHVLGTMLPDEAAAIMENAYKDVDKGVIKAKTNSPDPLVRQKNIEQLKSGQGYNHLDDADISGLLTAAEKRDRELNNLSESENLNAAIDHLHEATDGMTYEGVVHALNDGKWLVANGYKTADGKPDRVMADKLLQEADHQEVRDRKIQADKNNDITNKYYSQATKMTDPQIDKVVRDGGGSADAAKALKSIRHQATSEAQANYRFGEFVKGAPVRAAARDVKETQLIGKAIRDDLMRRITAGETIDMSQIWNKVGSGDMTGEQALQVQAHIHARNSADYAYDSTRIANDTSIDEPTRTKLTLDLLDAKTKQNLQGNEMHSFTDKLLQGGKQEQSTSWIKSTLDSLTRKPEHGSMTTPAATSDVQMLPQRPRGVPDAAVWNPKTKTWQLPK